MKEIRKKQLQRGVQLYLQLPTPSLVQVACIFVVPKKQGCDYKDTHSQDPLFVEAAKYGFNIGAFKIMVIDGAI